MKMDHFHPADDRLIALYFDDEGTGSDERRAVRQHLHGCETCTWRYTELTAPLQLLRRDAASEADEVFTPARLDAQRARILDRLEGTSDASRVIPFPAATPRLLDRSVVRRPLTRWVAAAAAAGLLIGVMAGRLLDTGADQIASPAFMARSAKSTVIPPRAADRLVPAVSSDVVEGDEVMLREIDLAVQSQRIQALSALDEMTPHLRTEAMLARSLR